jgi:hypothetical protein
MALPTSCQTPGAVFRTSVTDRAVSVTVDLPASLGLSEDEAVLLEANLHNAVELVLARYFAPDALTVSHPSSCSTR